MADRLIRCCCALSALLLASPLARAQTAWPDPTRPPASIAAPAPGETEVAGPLLQSVKIPKRGEPVALIGGRQVRLGERYGDRRLIALSEREAVLQGPAGVERLTLTPGIEKTNITTKSPAPRRAQRGGKP
jgi:MSHA biogenesis protein MshK